MMRGRLVEARKVRGRMGLSLVQMGGLIINKQSKTFYVPSFSTSYLPLPKASFNSWLNPYVLVLIPPLPPSRSLASENGCSKRAITESIRCGMEKPRRRRHTGGWQLQHRYYPGWYDTVPSARGELRLEVAVRREGTRSSRKLDWSWSQTETEVRR